MRKRNALARLDKPQIGLGLGLGLGFGRGGASRISGNRMIVTGDSIAAVTGYTLPVTSLVTDGSTTMVVNWTSHGLVPGSRIYGFRAANEAYNGLYTVVAVNSSSQFTVTLPVAIATATLTTARDGGSLHANKQHILTDVGAISWLSALNGACFEMAGVCAEGASQTSYLPTLIANADAGGLEYDWVTIIDGINDAAAGVAGTTIAANIIDVATDLRAAGKGVIISTIGPWGAAHASYTVGRYNEVKAANALLRAYAAATSGVYIMDAFAAGSDGDPDGAGVPAANMLSDNLHPTQLGVYTYAKRFMADNPGVLPAATTLLPETTDDDYYVNSAKRQFWQNPMLTGSGGYAATVANTGSTTGTIPQYQSFGAYSPTGGGTTALASSVAAAESGNGNAVVGDFIGEENNDVIVFRQTDLIPEALTSSESLTLAVRLRVEATGGGAPTQMGRNMLYCETSYGGSTRNIAAVLYNASQPAAAQYPQFTETLTLVTPRHPFTALASMTRIQPFINSAVKGVCANTYRYENGAMWASS